MTKQITFATENTNAVMELLRKYASDYEHIASTKDGEGYEVLFASSTNYEEFFTEFKNYGVW